ncbi:MAG: hypothetical protein WA775_00045 [Psychroserpens sp.]|uniref:hypothetical protein n=1 Tax=Psychroserpens sp. TaxID=2020870 RepID=UPI003C71589A
MNLKLLSPLVLLCALLVTPLLFSQTSSKSRNQRIVNYNDNVNAPLSSVELYKINEVYGQTTLTNVLNKPQRLKDIKNILRNRVEVILVSSKKDQKECTLLSEVPLMDFYVGDLQRDTKFNPENFNPLKYLFNFYSYGTHLYKVDNTNYFIYIHSQHQ